MYVYTHVSIFGMVCMVTVTVEHIAVVVENQIWRLTTNQAAGVLSTTLADLLCTPANLPVPFLPKRFSAAVCQIKLFYHQSFVL